MEINKARFYSIVYDTTLSEHERFNIGTYKEKKLHIMLKKYFEPDSAFHEIPTNGYIADIRRDGVITEIETSGFCGLKPKLETYLPEFKVNLVFPMAQQKYISWIDPDTSEITPRKKSPKKANAYDLLFELVYILPFVKNENLTIIAPLLEIDEYRLLNGWSRDRKRGSSKYESIPTDIFGMIVLSDDDDYRRLIPEACGMEFTVPEFAKAAKLQSRRAYAVVKVLNERGVIKVCGKKGRAVLYSRV
ncbi:MAG: hypothetical protein ACI4XJ_07300 [Eubacteriales bacterium]